MQINETLSGFGLQNKEDEVYLALLELGNASVNEIAIKANIKRTTAYDVLAGLIKKELVNQTIRGKKRLFYAESPDKLKKILEDKQNALEEILPILKSLHNTAGSEKPIIKYFEGKQGLKNVYRDTLDYQGELLAFVCENIMGKLGNEFADEYIKKRKKSLITVRAIGSQTEELEKYQQNDKEHLRETRLLDPEKFPFTIEMNIYGNKIAFMSFQEEMGVIIESKDIANNMKSLFELAWIGACWQNND